MSRLNQGWVRFHGLTLLDLLFDKQRSLRASADSGSFQSACECERPISVNHTLIRP